MVEPRRVLRYSYIGRLSLAAAIFIAAAPASLAAQRREITGKVTQGETGLPIAEASISVLGAQIGVRTNDKGEYKLTVPADAPTVDHDAPHPGAR